MIEDHPLYRDAVAGLLADASGIELGTVAGSVAQFAARRRDDGGGVVLLDLRLPGLMGSSAVMEVVGMGYRVLVLSAHSDQAEVLGAMAAGASGYLSKDCEADEILHAVYLVAEGNTYMSPMLASHVLDAFADRASPAIELSTRERQVLSLVAAGERDQDIAETLAISIRTVRSYLDRIRDKTGQRRRPELTRYAIEMGVTYGRVPA